ncbi:uncharacterized protein PAC_15144 [Phialocephala subalpina]|uniref:Uncharacterized protein n=1 Tax=Phialocephala subalpina TaxID=576137 RepID=A0A1L7XJR0_9HELO|nr:uncharacterized protein PAC_15144 [Phialocephala subalpina]
MSSISLKHLRISLGFDDASTGWQTLCKKTAEFRKSFVRCNAVTFPWKCDAIAQRCASDFFAKNEVLFDALSRLSKPEIINAIAELMCRQEWQFRQNHERGPKKEKVVIQEGSDTELEEETNADGFESTTQVIADQLQPVEETEEASTKNSIKEHLEYTYPITRVYKTVSSDWLFNPQQPWPDNEQAFAFRYIHEHNLYYTNSKNYYHVNRFASALQMRLDIKGDTAKVIIRQRCRELIKDISMLWSEKVYGSLVKTNTGVIKSNEFEEAWRSHRNSWILQVHGGITNGVIELTQEKENQSRKRLHNTGPAVPSPISVMNVEPSLKRPRHNIGYGAEQILTPIAKIPELHEDVTTIQALKPPHHLPTIHNFTPVQFKRDSIPKASSFTPIIELPNDGPAADWDRRTSRDTSTRLRPCSTRMNYVPQTRHASYFLLPCNSNITHNLLDLESARQTRSVLAGTVVERPKLPPAPIPESRFTLTSLSTIETEQRTPMDTKPSTHRAQESIVTPASLSTTETMQPTPPLFYRALAPSPSSSPFQSKRLQFILENSKRSPDYDNPLPDSDFRTLSLLEFFALFCQRGSRAREAISHLTFQYNWGHRDSFVVKAPWVDEIGEKEEGRKEEVNWEEIKERVRDTFLMAKDRYEKRVRFQVWVIGPEDENEDEEW